MIAEIAPVKQEVVAKYETRASDIVLVANGYVQAITDGRRLDEAGEFLTDVIRPLKDEIANSFDPITNSIKRALRETDALRKRIENPILEAEEAIKRALEDFHNRELEASRNARRTYIEQLQDVVDDANGVPIGPLTPPEFRPPTKIQGVSFRHKLDFSVVDVYKVGREFLTPDLAKIKKVVEEQGRLAEEQVGGIVVFERTRAAFHKRSKGTKGNS